MPILKIFIPLNVFIIILFYVNADNTQICQRFAKPPKTICVLN